MAEQFCLTAGCGRLKGHGGQHHTNSGWWFDTEAEYRAHTAWHPPTKDPATIAAIIDQHATANEDAANFQAAADKVKSTARQAEANLWTLKREVVTTDINRQIGRNIRAELARIGSNQGKAAEHLGLTQGGMSDRIHGRTPWRVVEVLQLANLAGVPVARLLDGIQ